MTSSLPGVTYANRQVSLFYPFYEKVDAEAAVKVPLQNVSIIFNIIAAMTTTKGLRGQKKMFDNDFNRQSILSNLI